MTRHTLRAFQIAMLILTWSAVSFLGPQDAFGETDGYYSSQVVQNRKHFGTHEFGVALGVLPLDAFKKGITVSGNYTIHFTEHVGWEVGQFFYSFHSETALNAELAAFDLRPTPFEVIDYYATSNLVFKPVYWKGSWLNSELIYGEIFLVAGGGYGWLTRSAKPAVDFGLGFRLFASTLLSLRLDLRYLLLFDATILENFDVHDELWLGLGTSLSF